MDAETFARTACDPETSKQIVFNNYPDIGYIELKKSPWKLEEKKLVFTPTNGCCPLSFLIETPAIFGQQWEAFLSKQTNCFFAFVKHEFNMLSPLRLTSDDYWSLNKYNNLEWSDDFMNGIPLAQGVSRESAVDWSYLQDDQKTQYRADLTTFFWLVAPAFQRPGMEVTALSTIKKLIIDLYTKTFPIFEGAQCFKEHETVPFLFFLTEAKKDTFNSEFQKLGLLKANEFFDKVKQSMVWLGLKKFVHIKLKKDGEDNTIFVRESQTADAYYILQRIPSGTCYTHPVTGIRWRVFYEEVNRDLNSFCILTLTSDSNRMIRFWFESRAHLEFIASGLWENENLPLLPQNDLEFLTTTIDPLNVICKNNGKVYMDRHVCVYQEPSTLVPGVGLRGLHEDSFFYNKLTPRRVSDDMRGRFQSKFAPMAFNFEIELNSAKPLFSSQIVNMNAVYMCLDIGDQIVERYLLTSQLGPEFFKSEPKNWTLFGLQYLDFVRLIGTTGGNIYFRNGQYLSSALDASILTITYGNSKAVDIHNLRIFKTKTQPTTWHLFISHNSEWIPAEFIKSQRIQRNGVLQFVVPDYFNAVIEMPLIYNKNVSIDSDKFALVRKPRPPNSARKISSHNVYPYLKYLMDNGPKIHDNTDVATQHILKGVLIHSSSSSSSSSR